jgi:molybdopterin synthase sulfur carrier subunit
VWSDHTTLLASCSPSRKAGFAATWNYEIGSIIQYMSISVRFFASLRETVGLEGATVEPDEGLTAGKVWSQVTSVPMPSHTLVAINMEYAKSDDPVGDGDEVAFFPPVTGG